MSKIVFCIACEDHLFNSFGGRKCFNSIKYFYPNATIDLYDSAQLERIKIQYPWSELVSYMPCIMKDCIEKHNADRIIKIDADSMILSILQESMDDNFDICGVLNDPMVVGKRDESVNRPYPIRYISNDKYMNCGFISTNSRKFIDEWLELNKEITANYGSIKTIPVAEQGTYNLIKELGGYKVKILDPWGSEGKSYWGSSANFDSGNGYVAPSITKEYGGSFLNWSSWYDIKYENNEFWLNGKITKIVHSAGGGKWENNDKLHWDRFNPNIHNILKTITNEN